MSRPDPYRSNSHGIEINLRKVMYDLLYGTSQEIAKGREGLLRRMRRDSNNDPIKCSCRDKISDEPDKDYYCRYCLGMGFFWDEVKIVYYRDGEKFYIEYGTELTEEDYVVTLKLDASGSPSVPITRDKYFKIMDATPYRSDQGRTEYWEAVTKEEREWSIWYGVKNRQHN